MNKKYTQNIWLLVIIFSVLSLRGTYQRVNAYLNERKGYKYLMIAENYFFAELQYKEAITFYKKALKVTKIPKSLLLLKKIGKSYENLGKYETAIYYYTKVLNNKPGEYGCTYISLGDVYLDLVNIKSNSEKMDINEYENEVKKVIEIFKKSKCQEANIKIGDIYFNLAENYSGKEFEKSLNYFRYAMRWYKGAYSANKDYLLCDKIQQVILNYGHLYFFKGYISDNEEEAKEFYDEAITHYLTVLTCHCNDFRLWRIFRSIGNCYFNKGDYKSAKKYYSKALKYSPGNELLKQDLKDTR